MDYTSVLISAGISIIVASVTGWFSAKQSYSKEIKKSIYEERQKLYIEIFSLLEQLQRTPYLIYNSEQFIQPFRQAKAKTNLYASREVLNILIPLNTRIMEIWNKYIDLFESEEAEKALENRRYEAEEKGDTPVEQIELEFEYEVELYMEQNLIPTEEIDDYLNSLATQIRAELKTE